MTPLREILHAYKCDDLTAAQAEARIVALGSGNGGNGRLSDYERMVEALAWADGEAYNRQRQGETVASMWGLGGDGA